MSPGAVSHCAHNVLIYMPEQLRQKCTLLTRLLTQFMPRTGIKPPNVMED